MSEHVEQPESQDPAATAEPVQTPQAPLESGVQGLDGPWAKDIESRFSDPQVRTQVDDFLRARVQPYVTGLETQAKDLEGAAELLSDLQADPGATYLALTEQFFGDQALEKVRGALTEVYGEPQATPETPADPAAPQPPPAAELPPELKELLPHVRTMVERDQDTADKAAYDAEIEQITTDDPTIVANEFHPFVVSAEGDYGVAINAYKQWQEQTAARYGGQVPPPEQPAPPAVLGSDTSSPAAPPVQERYETLDDAMDAMFAEQRAQAPPPVGVT